MGGERVAVRRGAGVRSAARRRCGGRNGAAASPAAASPAAASLAARAFLAAAGVFLTSFVVACAPGGTDQDAAETVADDLGRLLDVAEPRSRIVSLVPSATETLVEIGAGDRLIARTQYDEQPELASLPSLGDPLSPSIEALVELEPDLVVLWPTRGHGASVGERLDALGVPWFGALVHSVGDFRRLTGKLGRLVGLERAADSLLAVVSVEFRAVAELRAGRDPVPVVYVVQQDPPTTVGPGTFVDSILASAGAVNVFRDVGSEWPQVSMEEVVWRDPQYVIVPVQGWGTPPVPSGSDRSGAAVPLAAPDPSAHVLATAPGWRAVPAVAAGRVISVDASLFGRPGPRMAEAAAYLARRLHGHGGTRPPGG